DGVLGLDDVQDGQVVGKLPQAGGQAAGPASLVGRPLSEVERYCTEQALALTNGNREEAAKMLGIGERTLYRNIKEWDQQKRIREALDAAHGDETAAARQLGMDAKELHRKAKKLGLAEAGSAG